MNRAPEFSVLAYYPLSLSQPRQPHRSSGVRRREERLSRTPDRRRGCEEGTGLAYLVYRCRCLRSWIQGAQGDNTGVASRTSARAALRLAHSLVPCSIGDRPRTE